MAKKTTSFSMLCLIVISIIYTLFNPYRISFHAQSAIKLCATALVPTLFIFMVFSRMLSHLCTANIFGGKIISFLSALLKLPPCLIPICISGLFCGAPAGAFAICRMYDEGIITKKEAERACIFANNCSAAFILGFISALLGSKPKSVYIFISNIAATVFVYMIFFRGDNDKSKTKTERRYSPKPFSESLTESISSSVTATVTLCGYVIFFYTLTQVICQELMPFLHGLTSSDEKIGFINAAICSFFEISSGVMRISSLKGSEAVVLCAGAAGFTGLSMVFQVKGILGKSRLSAKNYFFSKCLCAFVSPIFTVLLMFLSPTELSVSSYTGTKTSSGVSSGDVISLAVMTCIALAGAYILSYLDKKHKK